MVDRTRILPRVRAHQLTGCSGRRDVTVGLLTRHRRSCTLGRAAIRLWILLHPELSFRYRYGELRPIRNDGNW